MPSARDRHLGEIETVLLHIAEARRRVSKARQTLAREGAPDRLIASLAISQEILDGERLRLQSTANPTPDERQRLAV
jgi:hypothetical protein